MNKSDAKIAGFYATHADLGEAAEIVPEALEADVQQYAFNLSQAIGPLGAAELLVGAAFMMLDRAEGGESVRSFARRCYWGAIQASSD